MYHINDFHLTHFHHLCKFYNIQYHPNNHPMVPKTFTLSKLRHTLSNHISPKLNLHLHLSILLHRPCWS